MQGFEFLFNLLGTTSGSAVYHLLIALALVPAVGIVWTEWRQSKNDELEPYVFAIAGTMLVRIVALVLAPFHLTGDSLVAVFSAPWLYAVELLSVFLLFGGFAVAIWPERRKLLLRGLLGGWFVVSLGLAIFWYVIYVQQLLITYNDFGQIPVWYLLLALASFVAAGLILRFRRDTGWVTPAAFGLLGAGALMGFGGALFGGIAFQQTAEGIARLIWLIAYPLFAVAFYSTSLQDLNLYRDELKGLSDQSLVQRQEMLFLIEATRSIGESLDLRGMLGQVAEIVAQALRADRVSIFLAHQEKPNTLILVGNYRVLGHRYSPPQEIPMRNYPVLSFAMRQPQMVFGPNDDYTTMQPVFTLLGIEKPGPVLIQPLARQKQVMGLLLACNDYSGNEFTSEQENLATTVAVQIAGAVENSRLYRALEDKAKELAQLLTAREEEFQRQEAILESMAEGILVSDPKGRIILVNAAAEEIVGVERETLRGRLVTELLTLPTTDEGLEAAALIDITRPIEVVFDLHDRKLRVHAAPVLMQNGARLGVVAILADITRESLAEEAKREFIASISHELRTPLTAIKGYSELLLGGMAGMLPAGPAQFLGVIRENALRMSSLTDNIISVAEIERGRLGLNYQSINVGTLINEVVSRYRERIAQRQLKVTVDAPEGLPTIEADANRLRMVIDNLVNNAVKFTYPEGKIHVGVRMISDNGGKPAYISIAVADNGVGIEVNEQPLIWDRYYRANNPLSLEAGGLGIGLPIARALAEAHGGRIWVDSIPGQGSTFSVLIPISRAVGAENGARIA